MKYVRARVYIIGALAFAAGSADAPKTATAQSVPAFQSGTALPNDLAKFVRPGQIRDAAGIAGDNNGAGVNPFSITDYGQLGLCSNTAPTSQPYSSICFGHDPTGSGVISLFSTNGEPPHPMKFVIDGVQQTPTFGGPYLPLIGGTISGTAPGTITINRRPTLPPSPAIPGFTPALWIAGNAAENTALLMDGTGAIPGLVFRRANGSGNSPVVTDDHLGQIGARGYGSTAFSASNARIEFRALEDFTDTAQGTKIVFQTSPQGTNLLTQQAQIGPGLAVGLPTPPADGQRPGDINGERLFQQGIPVTSGGPYLPLVGGTIAGSPGRITINRKGALPPDPDFPGFASALWIAGNTAEPTAIVSDGTGAPTALVFRRANGTGTSPVLSGDNLGFVSARGYGITAFSPSNARIEFTALENFTDSQQGTKIAFSVTPAGSNVRGVEATIGPGLTVGTPTPPPDGQRSGDVNALRVMIQGAPALGSLDPVVTGSLTVNRNPTMPPAAPGIVPVFHGVGNVGENPAVLLDSIASSNAIVFRRANGVGTSPATAGDNLGQLGARGYGTTGYGASGARIEFTALQNFTDTQQGAALRLLANPLNSTTLTLQATFGPGLVVGNPTAPPAGWPAIGDAVAQRLAATELVLVKSGAASAVGTNFGRLVLTSGTTAGTCKLVVYAGASSTPTTVADNIGSGC